jgi:hypothetical protein
VACLQLLYRLHGSQPSVQSKVVVSEGANHSLSSSSEVKNE